ncbi:hypothetical protein ACPF8X_10805 [Streptomyces sp. G35A]
MSREHRPAAAGGVRAAAGPRTTTTSAPLPGTDGSDISRYRGGANKETQ